jgi:Polyketide cyclase / dehydrase and lipid transport
MKKGERGEARLHVNAPPEMVYELVSDVTRMGEWSPETVRCRWLDGADGPAVGVRFKGTNRRGFMRWSTKPRVVGAEPGREFAFVANLMVFHRDMTMWRYRFEPAVDGGTDLTESFEMLNDLPWYISFGERWLVRIKDRKADLEAGMQRTLERIRAAAERGA